MLDVLTLTRQALGATPRRLPRRLIRPAPAWAAATPADALEDGKALFRDGYLTSSYVVQASSFLFEPSALEGSAVAVHAPSSAAIAMDRLIGITGEVARLTSSDPEDPEQAALVRRLAGERGLLRVPVPRALSRGAPAVLSTVDVRPSDLPGRHLRAWFLPLLAHPEIPALIVLPRELWAPDLVLAWEDLAAEALERAEAQMV